MYKKISYRKNIYKSSLKKKLQNLLERISFLTEHSSIITELFDVRNTLTDITKKRNITHLIKKERELSIEIGLLIFSLENKKYLQRFNENIHAFFEENDSLAKIFINELNLILKQHTIKKEESSFFIDILKLKKKQNSAPKNDLNIMSKCLYYLINDFIYKGK